jgi:serine/threonine protein kinase
MRRAEDVDGFGLERGRRLAGKYVVGHMLGKGWEGEVYHVTETSTGIERAAKFFYPKRNPENRAINFYARKLNKLRHCSIIIQYHTQETFRHQGIPTPFLVSEYVNGEILSDLVGRTPGRRLPTFEALHLLYALVRGVEEIHHAGEYHGDLHSDNIMVKRRGLGFEVKVVDMYHWGRATPEHFRDDICALVQLLHEVVGGARHYAKQPREVKAICCGLKRSLIVRKFRNIERLRVHLETLEWN